MSCHFQRKIDAHEKYLKKIHAIENDLTLLSHPTHINLRSKLTFTCDNVLHDSFNILTEAYLRGKVKCKQCVSEDQTKYYIQRINSLDVETYVEEYPKHISAKSLIDIMCPKHGNFSSYVHNYLNGHGCPDCGRIMAAKSRLKTVDQLKKIANKKHNNLYDYSLWLSREQDEAIPIICKKHGIFHLLREIHTVAGIGCPHCTAEKYKHPKALNTDVQEKLDDKQWLIQKHYIEKLTLTEIANLLTIGDATIGTYMKKHKLKTKRYPVSSYEKIICSILDEYEIDYISNDRTVLKSGKELDIVIKDSKLAIEICGLYYHSEQGGKDKNYHKNKLEEANAAGYRLLTIFEDEMLNQQDMVIEKILSMLKKSRRSRVYARQCTITFDPKKEDRKKLLDTHHIQGNGHGGIAVGLMYGDELVAIALFENNKVNYNLKRFATSVDVVGGFTKIMKHFLSKYNDKHIITFADLRWSEGALYENNGWDVVSLVRPTYYYSVDKTSREHKFNFRHKCLQKKLENYDPNLTEFENCDNAGLYRIWDCGKIKYEYTKHLE